MASRRVECYTRFAQIRSAHAREARAAPDLNLISERMPMTQTMKALVKTERKAGLTLMQRDVPHLGPNDVLIKVRATSICGTDLHIYNWDPWSQGRVKAVPLIQGHEVCGDIVDTGSKVTERKVGDFVSCESHIVNYQGEYYKRGLGHVAPETKI